MHTHSLKKKHRGPFLIIVAMVVFIGCAAAAMLGLSAFFKYYVPDVEANTYEPFEPVDPSNDDDPDGSLPGIVAPSDNADPGQEKGTFVSDHEQSAGRYNFLIVGLDKVSNSTDIMMVVSYDVKNGKINVIQIPRDTYFHTDGVSVTKINSYYSIFLRRAKNDGVDDPEGRALSNLAALIEHNFGIRLNYCAVVGVQGFVEIIDAVGGVWLDVPNDMRYDDPYQDLHINIKKGYQHLDGEHAMQFVRYRKGYIEQDLGRQDALKNFMAALMSQLKSNLTVSAVSDIVKAVMEHMYTNIGFADFVYFAKQALSVDLNNIMMATLPGESAMVSRASVYVLYRDDCVDLINRYLNVFDEDLTADDFDPDSVMVADSVRDIYESPLGTADGGEYNAGDVNENPIKIPRSK